MIFPSAVRYSLAAFVLRTISSGKIRESRRPVAIMAVCGDLTGDASAKKRKKPLGFVLLEDKHPIAYLCRFLKSGSFTVEQVKDSSPDLGENIRRLCSATENVLIAGGPERLHSVQKELTCSEGAVGDKTELNVSTVRFPFEYLRPLNMYASESGLIVLCKLAVIQSLLAVDAEARRFEEVFSDVPECVTDAFKCYTMAVMNYLYNATKSGMLLLDPDRFLSIMAAVNVLSPLLEPMLALTVIENRFEPWKVPKKSWPSVDHHPMEEQFLLTIRVFNSVFPYITEKRQGITRFFPVLTNLHKSVASVGSQDVSEMGRPLVTEELVRFVKNSEYISSDLTQRQRDAIFLFTCHFYGKFLGDHEAGSPEVQSVVETVCRTCNVMLYQSEDNVKLGLGLMLHAALVKNADSRMLPVVLSDSSLFRLVVAPCLLLLKHTTDAVVEKSLELLVVICGERLADARFGRECAEIDGVRELFSVVLRTTRYNRKRGVRSLALDAYYGLLQVFGPSGKTYIFSELLRMEEEVGVREFLTVEAKSNFFAYKLQLGLPLHRLVESVFRIPPSSLADGVGASHWLIAAIGFAKILMSMGFTGSDQSRVFLAYICKEFVLPLRACMRETYERLNAAMLASNEKKPKGATEMSVQIGYEGDELPELTLEQKIRNVELSMTTLFLLRQEYLTLIRALKALPEDYMTCVPAEVFDHGLGSVE